jgi:hypothetical protein
MRRREFIALFGGGVASWPVVARGQQPERMRRIGVLMDFPADDPEAQARIAAFSRGCRNEAGLTAAMCGSSTGRALAMPIACGDPRRN